MVGVVLLSSCIAASTDTQEVLIKATINPILTPTSESGGDKQLQETKATEPAFVGKTPLITKTAVPFSPMKVSAPDCGYGGKIKSLEALDEYAVIFKFCEPEAAFLEKIAFPAFVIQSADWLEKIQQEREFAKLLDTPIGTGPYQLAEWRSGEYITFTAFDNYWVSGKPEISILKFFWDRDPSQRLLALQTGVVDGIDNLNPPDFHVIQEDPNLIFQERPAMNIFYIGINNRSVPFDNKGVRKALAMGLDRQKIIEAAFPEGYQMASHFSPCEILFGCEGKPWYSYDPQLAKELLSEAGFSNGFRTELFYRDVIRGYLPYPDLAAEEIQKQLWENLHVDVKLRKMDQDKFFSDVDSGLIEGLYLLGWGADYPEITNFLDFHFGDESSQQFGDKNDELITLLDLGARVNSMEERSRIYSSANDIIRETVPMIPVSHGGWYFHYALAVAYQADVENRPVDQFGFETFLNATVPEQNVFRWMQTEEPLSLYCPDETDLDSLRACMQIYETLYSFENNHAKVAPKLAEICEANYKFTEWRCQLRQGITFHDQTSLDANDVVMSFLIQWDEKHPLHLGKTGGFEYFETFWGGFLNAK